MEDKKSHRSPDADQGRDNEADSFEKDPADEEERQDPSAPKNMLSTEVDQLAGWTFDCQRLLVKRIGHPIQLSNIEFHILRHLAARPYWAYTRKQIAKGVSQMLGRETLLEEAAVDRHITTLRDKLGMLSDHIQSVPYVGYRFKE